MILRGANAVTILVVRILLRAGVAHVARTVAIDRVEPHRQEVIEQAVWYARTDLLCYRADSPPELTDRQAASWQPLLDWAAETYRVRLRVTRGVTPVGQPEAALDALRAAVEALDDLELAALARVAGASGSLIVALALAAGRIGADEAHAVSQVDESYQVEKWGEDAEAQARCRRLHADIAAAAAFLALARG